jgi:IMP dehydrogenase
MHRVVDVMSHNVVYVTPDDTVRTAVDLLRAQEMDVVPVVDQGRVIGLLDALTLSLFDGEVSVTEAIREEPVTVDVEMPLSEAAMRMRRHKLRQVPVLRGAVLVGLLSEHDLLTVWGMANDPLTDLPVQHQLRRWSSLQLSAGKEIAILFLDIDNFGVLNKQRGHVFGDEVLKSIAQVLRENVEPELDFVCRYGGDEFAIGTIRMLDSARELAAKLRDRVSELCVNNQVADLGVAIGMAGGQRLRPRTESHVDATLDNLLTQASTASTAAKHIPDHIWLSEGSDAELALAHAPHAPLASTLPRLVVEGYAIGATGQQMEITVGLRQGHRLHERKLMVSEAELPRGIATATAECLQTFAREPVEIRVEETYEYTTPQGLTCVGATVALKRVNGAESLERLVGVSAVRGDLHRSYINAVLDALNRRLLRA